MNVKAAENSQRAQRTKLQEYSKKFVFGRAALLGFILFLGAIKTLNAQDASQEPSSLEELPGLRERAVMMRIVSRIIEQNQQVVWNAENSRATIPGRPVGLKLVGSNLVVAVQFTPFLRPQGMHVLIAQAQVWVDVPGEGIRYYTTMQTIPLQFREQVYFFPLGSMDAQDEAQIEIQLVMEPYSGRRHSANNSREEGESSHP